MAMDVVGQDPQMPPEVAALLAAIDVVRGLSTSSAVSRFLRTPSAHGVEQVAGQLARGAEAMGELAARVDDGVIRLGRGAARTAPVGEAAAAFMRAEEGLVALVNHLQAS